MTKRRSAAMLAFGLALTGCGGSASDDVGEMLSSLRESSIPYVYLGERFEGLPLTHVEVEGAYGIFVYGDCQPISDTGCAPPLQLQTLPCGDTLYVAIFGEGVRGGRAARAARNLVPVNEVARGVEPEVIFDRGPRCPSA